jgi:nucleoside-diphosphate-sugar epimerase
MATRKPGRILVTGASGFVGMSTLRPLLNLGYEIVGTYYRGRPPRDIDVSWRQVDLLSEEEAIEAVEKVKPDILLALAWDMSSGNYSSLNNLVWLAKTITLMRAFADSGGKRLVVCGSSAEYDWSCGDSCFDETETPLHPATLYGRAKVALYWAFLAICREYRIRGTWLRPFFLYGPHEAPHRLIPFFIRSLLAGTEATCRSANLQRDYLHIDDAGNAIANVIDQSTEGPINIGSGIAIPISEIVLEIGHQLGAESLIRLEEQPTREPIVRASTKRLREGGWTPKIELADGIRQTIQWWESQEV